MNWLTEIDKIVVLNLLHRTDRLLSVTEQFEKYKIPFERYEAIRDTQQGAKGLRDTMVKLFNEELEKGTEHLLVFEDDVKIVADDYTFHDTMNKIVESFPFNYHMILLGCQLTKRIDKFFTANLIPVQLAFSTHAVLYSKTGMMAIIDSDLGYPIDNDMVAKIQPMGLSFCTYPLLCSQIPGHSDIGGNYIEWDKFISPRYEQKINEFRRR